MNNPLAPWRRIGRSARKSSQKPAPRVASPARPALAVEELGEDLAGFVAVDETQLDLRWRCEKRRPDGVDGVLGAAGGMTEAESTVNDRLGSQETGERLSPDLGVLEHQGHELAKEAP